MMKVVMIGMTIMVVDSSYYDKDKNNSKNNIYRNHKCKRCKKVMKIVDATTMKIMIIKMTEII